MTSGHPGHTGGWKVTHLAAAVGGGPHTRVLGVGEGLSLLEKRHIYVILTKISYG